MSSVALVFSTLLLDENIQHPVVLPKQDLKLHLPSELHQNKELPVFHFITVLQQNTKYQSLMTIDSGHEIQFGLHLPKEDTYHSEKYESTIITLHQPAPRTEYAPHLVNNSFDNIKQIKDLIVAKGYISISPDPFTQSSWTESQHIPIPMERGNLFFPSFPYHDGNNLSNPFYDVSPVPFRYGNNKIWNINPGKYPTSDQTLDKFAMCENITQPCQYMFYDEIIAEVFMKNFKPKEIANIDQDYICCPFIFPVQCNLHHMIIHPDTLFLQQQEPNCDIFREHRSPAFNIIAKLTPSKLREREAIVLSPVCLYAFIQGKELFFKFKNHLSAIYLITDHKENFLKLFSRKPRKALTPKLWASDTVTFDYLVSKSDPVRLNLDGTAELPVKYMQPRTVHVGRLSPANTVAELCNSFAPCTLEATLIETSIGDNQLGRKEENSTPIPITSSNSQHKLQKQDTWSNHTPSTNFNSQHKLQKQDTMSNHTPSTDFNDITIKQTYLTSDDETMSSLPSLSRSPSPPLMFNTNLNFNTINVNQLETEFGMVHTTANFTPLKHDLHNDLESCLTDFLNGEFKAKTQRNRPRICPYNNETKYQKNKNIKIIEREHDKLDAEVEECLMELDSFLYSLEDPEEQGLNTPPIINTHLPKIKKENEPAKHDICQNDGSITAESSLENIASANECSQDIKAPNYDIFSLSLHEKSLFLFESEFREIPENEQHVPKLLAKIKLGNEYGQFEDITALVDSGADVSLITMNRIKSLVSESFILDNLEKENAVLTSFSNNGIKIDGKLQLRFKLNNNGPIKVWKFLIISQNSMVDMIIGNDMLMHFCMSIQIKSQNKPEIILPNNEPVATFYEKLNQINECQKDIKLKPKQKAYIKILPHPAFTAFRNERLLVEGAMECEHLVVPLACKILPDGRLPLAVVNHSNSEILEKVKIIITRVAPDQKIIGHRDIKDIQVYTLMVPVQISNEKENLEIQSAESTKEINIYKMDVQYVPPKSFNPKEEGQTKKVKVFREKTASKAKNPDSQENVMVPTDITPVTDNSQKMAKESDPDEENKFSPENFWKDMDGKFLPPGYEVFQDSKIEDIVKLEEYPPSIRKYIKDIFIDKYSEIISKNDYEIGQLSNTLGPIRLHLKQGSKLPPFKKIYFLEPTQAQALKDILSYLMKENIIEKCGVNDHTGFNGFSSPAYLVSKANPEKSAYRLIVNYKNLNNELLLTPPILPSINQCLQKLRRGYVFSQFDLSSAFYSLTLDKESRKLTMFSTCYGNFKFKSLAMGLATSPGAFCHIANDLIHTEPVRDENGDPIFTAPGMVKRISSPLDFACIYFDDVCIYSTLQPTYEETVKVHFDCVEQVMKRLHFHVAKLKWSKTELLRTEIIFLGHKISNGQAYADPRRVDKLLSAKFPTNLNLLRSFLGLLNSLRSYLPPEISRNMTTLQELTSTKKGFHPADQHRQAFENLKLSLTREPLFTSIVDPAGHYYLFCDAASGEKANFSAVLTQVIRSRENEFPQFLNKCDPMHNYIYNQDLRYRPIPLYLGAERICKTKVDRKIYDPIFIPSYYEKKNLGFSEANLNRTWFISIQSIFYDMNCKFLDEAEVRKDATLICKKGLMSHKIKTYCFGGHHMQAKNYLQDFQEGKANIDSFLFMMDAVAEAIKRTIILIILDQSESVSTKVLNANQKSELIIGVYTIGNKKLFYPFKRVDADTLRVYDFQNRIQICGFYSKSIPQGTSLLDIAQIEALGLLFTLEHYRPYIKMSKLTIITDNLVFFAILSKKVLDCSTILSRYALKILISYPQCRIRHILTSHNLADFLTRENKIDKNTLLRLPLSAFTVDNELARQIDQKKEYTFLEMRDFCDQNQQFIQIQPDVMGRKRVTVRKHDQIKDQRTRNLFSLTYDNNKENKYYDADEEIMVLLDNPKSPDVHDNPFSQVNEFDPQQQQQQQQQQISAITRSKDVKINMDNTDKTTAKQVVKENKQKNKSVQRKNVKQSAPSRQPPKDVDHFNQIQHNQEDEDTTDNVNTRRSARLNKLPINKQNKKNIKDKNNQNSQNLQENVTPAQITTTTDVPQEQPVQAQETNISSHDKQEIENQTVSEPYLYQNHDNNFDPELNKAERNLDKIHHPNPRLNNSGQAVYPKVDPFKAQQSLVELMVLRTNHPNLRTYQKEEFKELIEECRMSPNFQVMKTKGTYSLKNELLYYQENENEEKIVLPSALRGFVIGVMHIIKQHAGVKRMANELAHYYIPGLTKLLTLYLSSCFTCFLNNRQKSAQLGHVPIIRAGYVFHIDLAEGLPSNNGYKHILLVVDPFSKLLLTCPLKEKTSAQVLPYLTHTIFQLFHVRMILSDGGTCFSSQEFRKTMSDLYIVHKIVSAHHPQSNSHAESKVKRLKDMLRKMLSAETSTDWLIRLPLATKVLNCTKLGEIPLSPLEILYGKDEPNTQHLLTTPYQDLEVPPYKSATQIQQQMKPILAKYKKLVNERNVNRKKKINKNLKNPDIKVGSYIIIKDFAILKGINKTLHNIYRNEFYIVERVKPRSVVAKSLSTHLTKLIAFSHIKVVNEANYSKLEIPPVLWKLLVKDARLLTQEEKIYIASNSQALILPEPNPEIIEEFLSDSEDEENLQIEDQNKHKEVTFDLNQNKVQEF